MSEEQKEKYNEESGAYNFFLEFNNKFVLQPAENI